MKHFETEYLTHDQVKLFLQAWMPDAQPSAALLLVHGLGEHSSRYEHLAKKLVDAQIAVFTFDGRGHGKSSPPKPTAFFGDYLDYLQDIDALYEKVKKYVPDVPSFIFGHSMGGGLVAAYALKYQPNAQGIILSAPALKPGEEVSRLMIHASPVISRLFPKLKALQLDSTKISRDPEEVKKYQIDPLVYHEGIPARTGNELLKMMAYIEQNRDQFHYPVLLLHGTGDQLTNIKGTESFFRHIPSTDKTFHRYPDLFHELINEFEKESILQDILDWIEVRKILKS
jgi:alpha-beta hydrolase superfamily lysophospholipase